jgi:hypothetical protein
MSRYHAVRALDTTRGYGPPLILDLGHKSGPRMHPHPGPLLDRSPTQGDLYPEWRRTPEGIWLPLPGISGGVGIAGEMQKPYVSWPGDVTFGDTGGITGQALDSAYTYNSAADALACRTTLSTARTLSGVYYFVVSSLGSPTGLELEIRRNATSTTPVTGSTSVATTTDVPSLTASRWNKVSWSVSNVGGHATDEFFWTIISDANGSATDRWTIARFMQNVGPTLAAIRMHKSFITTGGWAASNTDDVQISMIVLVFSDGTAQGWPWSSVTAASGTGQTGLSMPGLTADLKIFGVRVSAPSGTPSRLFVWEGTGGPLSGTDLLSSTTVYFPELGYIVFAPITLAASTPYRISVDANGGTYSIRRWVLGTLASGTADEILAASLFGGAAVWTQSSGATWVDTTTLQPQMQLFIEDQVAAVGGSGGGLKLAGRGGLAA